MAISERFRRRYTPHNEKALPVQVTTQMSPVPPEELAKADYDAPDPVKRALLKGIVYGGISTAVAKTGLNILEYIMDADAAVTERRLVRREGSVQFVNRDSHHLFPFTASLFYRGFNVDQTDNAASAMSPWVARFGQVAAVDYGNVTFDIGEITEKTIDFCKKNKIYKVNLIGRSMGGMVALEMVKPLNEAQIEIESANFDCTPASNSEVIGAKPNDAMLIAIYNQLADWNIVSYGGDATRTIAEKQINDVMRSRDPRKALGGRKSNNELPNNIVPQQAAFIYNFGVNDTMVNMLQGVPMAYFAAEKDTTVDCLRSCDKFRTALPDSPIQLYELQGIGHASSSDHPDIYGPRMLQFRKEAKLPLWTAAI